MSSIPVDLNRSKMRLLLEELAFERLDREGAMELKPLLETEARLTMDTEYKKRLINLIETLDKYIKGEVNLMPELNVTLSNV